jgi:hypothetical protein
MSEFPEWVERAGGMFWTPSYQRVQAIHRNMPPDPRTGRERRQSPPSFWRMVFDRRRAERRRREA